MDKFIPPTADERLALLNGYSEPYDRLIRENERHRITSVSRTTAYTLEKSKRFPARKMLGRNSCAWLLSDLLFWIHNPPKVDNVNNPHSRKPD